MKSIYKSIGQYIRVIDVRNVEGKTDNLLGVSVNKVFIKSIANTIGTDFTTYRVVKKNQFTYIPDTSRRGDKIGLALLEEDEDGLVSQAYTVFEIIDQKKLDPQYLMMWFRRPEFDRYARFISHGSVREIFTWEDMCNVALPIPHIDKQREIVKEYNTIVNRIKLNELLNQKLEETAQALYKQWFIDFEFPDENGKPYKSNGGEMVYNETFEQEIPVGWKEKQLSSLLNIKHGFAYKGEYITTVENNYVLLSPGNFLIGGGFKGESYKYYLGTVPKDYIFKSGDIMVTMTDLSVDGDTLGYPAIIPDIKGKYFLHNQRLGKIEFQEGYKFKYFIYMLMRTSKYRHHILGSATGTTVRHTSPSRILDFYFPLSADFKLLEKFETLMETLNSNVELKSKESFISKELIDLFNSKISTPELLILDNN